MAKYILSIDQGTTGSTAMIMDSAGRALAKKNQEFDQIYPQPGWVEHNPEAIWKSVLDVIQAALKESKISSKEIAAIGITNQRETSVAWEITTNKALYNAIVWQCRRTRDRCQKLRKKGLSAQIKKKTGLVLDPYFSATKFQWLLENSSEVAASAKEGRLCLGTIDSYLIAKLTRGKSFTTDVSNASRTMLMNLDTGEWDQSLLKIFKVKNEFLPEIKSSNDLFGYTENVEGLPDGIPIHGVAGDQQAALFGQTAFSAGDAKCTFGTGSFILMNTGKKKVNSKSGLLTTVAWRLKGQKQMTYALEGGAFICGAAVQWLRDELKMISKSAEVESLANSVSDTGGVILVPAFAGLGAPHWDPDARALLCGMTRGTNRAHIARATLEAMALQNGDILTAMQKDAGKKIKTLKVDGGASANGLLMQMQSDVIGSTTHRPEMIETTSAGAAYLAGLGVGIWKSPSEIKDIWKKDAEFKPKMTAAARKKQLDQWKKAIKRARL